MGTLLTIIIVLGAIGIPFGIMQCASGNPLSIIVLPFVSVFTGFVIVLIVGFWLVKRYVKFYWNLLPASFRHPCERFMLNTIMWLFNHLPAFVRYKLGDMLLSCDVPTVLDMHEAGFNIFRDNEYRGFLNMRKDGLI